MGLFKFLHKATRAVGKLEHNVSHTIEHTAASAAHLAANAGKAVGHAASGAAAGAAQGLQSATRAVGKVGVGHLTLGNVSRTLTHAGIGNVSLAGASTALGVGLAKVSHIPILGPIIGVTTPLHFVDAANHFANGQRVDRAALSVLKNEVKDYKAVAPYAASVVAVVPGIGTGAAAAIAAGAALADGKRWDQIALEAAKGAIPGGNIAKAAFDVAQATVAGKKIDQIALAALPIDDKAKTAIAAGLALTRDLAAGKRIDQALLSRVNDAMNIAGVKGHAGDAIASSAALARDLAAGKDIKHALLARADDAMKLAGPEVAKALHVGTAIGTANMIQQQVMKHISSPQALQALADMGGAAIKNNPVLAHGLALSHQPNFTKGFAIASGVMSGKQATESALLGIRDALDSDGKKGFDAAAAYFIGKHEVSKKPIARRNPPKKIHKATGKPVPSKQAGPAQSFAYFATNGLVGAGTQQKEVIVKKLAEASSEMRDGAVDAIRAIGEDRRLSSANRSFWQNMGAWFTANQHGL